MTLLDVYSEFLAAEQAGDSRAVWCRDFISHKKLEQKERDPLRLYCTDMGKCHRAVAYRMLGATPDPHADTTIQMQKFMWDLAEYIEQTLACALQFNDSLIDYQGSVPMGRENWGGRFDIIANHNGVRVIEVKTIRSSAFNYIDEYPKEEHVFQARLYDWLLFDEFALDQVPVLWYADRGGSNPPAEFWLPETTDEDYIEMGEEMDRLECVREDIKWMASDIEAEAADALPLRLPRVLKKRNRGKVIQCEADHRCGYCDYSETCRPDVSKSVWANADGPFWTPTKAGDVDLLAEWAVDNTPEMAVNA